jgi:outer membrane protein TolC
MDPPGHRSPPFPILFQSTINPMSNRCQFMQKTAYRWVACGLSMLGHLASGDTAPLSLPDAINASLQHNLSLQIQRYEPRIAEFQLTEAEAAFDPELFASASVSQTEQGTTFATTQATSSDRRNWQVGARKRFATGASVTAQTNLIRSDNNAGVNTSNLSQTADASLSIRQPVLRGFGSKVNKAGVNRALAGIDASVEEFRDTLLAVLAETETAYWNLAARQASLELKVSSVRVAENLLEEAKERERLGIATTIEVLQAESALAARREALISARLERGNAEDSLRTLMGLMDYISAELEAPSLATDPLLEQPPLQVDFSTAWQQTLALDPDMAGQEARIEQARLDKLTARDNARPNLDLFATGAYIGLDDEDADEAYSQLGERQGHAWTLGIEFSMPWGFRSEKAALRAADARIDQANLRLDEIKLEKYRQLRAAWRALESAREGRQASEISVRLQEATFDRERSRAEEGLAVLRDVLETQQDLDEAQERLLQARTTEVQARIRLEQLTGQLLLRHGLNLEDLLNR